MWNAMNNVMMELFGIVSFQAWYFPISQRRGPNRPICSQSL